MDKEATIKTTIYGTNFLTPSFINLISGLVGRTQALNKIASSANPYGAMFFGALDLLGLVSGRIANSRFTRMTKLAGAGFYGLSTLADVLSLAGGEYSSFVNLPFDASMAYQLGRDTIENYGSNDIVDDVRDTVRSVRGLSGRVRAAARTTP